MIYRRGIANVGCGFFLLTLLACGQKKSDDSDRSNGGFGGGDQGALRPVAVQSEGERPTCSVSTRGMLIYIRDLDQFQICLDANWEVIERQGARGTAGEAGAKGDKGDAGAVGSTLGFNVKDASGQVIGTTDFHEYAEFLYNSQMFFRLSDGVVMLVSVATGRNAGQFCYYASADCTGTCLYPAKPGEKNKVVEGLNSLFKVTGTEASSLQSYQSYASADNPAPQCTGLGAPVAATMIPVVAVYAPPSGLSYPFSAPITVEPQ